MRKVLINKIHYVLKFVRSIVNGIVLNFILRGLDIVKDEGTVGQKS